MVANSSTLSLKERQLIYHPARLPFPFLTCVLLSAHIYFIRIVNDKP